MQVKTLKPSNTEAILTVIPSGDELRAIKDHTLGHFRSRVKIAGFREGRAPLELVEKQADQAALQTEFIEEAINQLYPQAVRSANIKPVLQPEISIKKFVPFFDLEFEAKVPVIGEIKLADYKHIKKLPLKINITAKDVNEILESLRNRLAEKKDVDRAAKNNDQVWIDFKGTDNDGKPVSGADGKDYPLILGSDTFIPGFETNLLGMRAGETKAFTLQFPKNYTVKALAGRDVTFEVVVTKVQEVILPSVNDDFAAKAGPFKTLAELKKDIKQQLTIERQHQAGLDFESELVREISDKSTVEMPDALIDSQAEQLKQELKQNLTYRGQTFQEFLESEAKTEAEYTEEVLKPQASERVKASLVLAEIAEKEKIQVTPEEVEVRIQVLKGQHRDAAMQAELDKPESRQEISYRMLSEKTVAQLAQYATSKS